MGYTKRQFIIAALEEAGLANYVYDLSPEQIQSACRKMDQMIGTWQGKGIELSYPTAIDPDNTNVDTETNVPAWANEAIVTNLAVKLGPQYGKNLSIETKMAAKSAYEVLLLQNASVIPMQFPNTLPVGGGNKRNLLPAPFMPSPDTSPIRSTPNDQLFLT
jgi:hypothetical protein